MPIEYRIVHEHRILIAKARGNVIEEDIFGYQHEVWSRTEVDGYDELVDMSDVERIVLPSINRVRELVSASANMDKPSKSRFAIVAPNDYAFGLARMFQAYRELDVRSTKRVAVFRCMEDALAFLNLATLP